MKININYNKDPFFIHRSIIDILLFCLSPADDRKKPYLSYFLANCQVSCGLKLDFEFAFETALHLMRSQPAVLALQARHNMLNSCYQNYFKTDLGELILRLLKLYEAELRECSSLEVLKEAARQTQ